MDGKLIAFAVVGLLVGIGAGVGAGFMLWNGDAADGETYSFYLHFGADDRRNGWYSAEGTDALEGFDKAMEKAGFKWEVSNYGYLGTVDGKGAEAAWCLYQYLYKKTDKDAAANSISEFDGVLSGWNSMSGYGAQEIVKMGQFTSNVYFFTPYNADWTHETPATVKNWMTTGPFAA